MKKKNVYCTNSLSLEVLAKVYWRNRNFGVLHNVVLRIHAFLSGLLSLLDAELET